MLISVTLVYMYVALSITALTVFSYYIKNMWRDGSYLIAIACSILTLILVVGFVSVVVV